MVYLADKNIIIYAEIFETVASKITSQQIITYIYNHKIEIYSKNRHDIGIEKTCHGQDTHASNSSKVKSFQGHLSSRFSDALCTYSSYGSSSFHSFFMITKYTSIQEYLKQTRKPRKSIQENVQLIHNIEVKQHQTTSNTAIKIRKLVKYII